MENVNQILLITRVNYQCCLKAHMRTRDRAVRLVQTSTKEAIVMASVVVPRGCCVSASGTSRSGVGYR